MKITLALLITLCLSANAFAGYIGSLNPPSPTAYGEVLNTYTVPASKTAQVDITLYKGIVKLNGTPILSSDVAVNETISSPNKGALAGNIDARILEESASYTIGGDNSANNLNYTVVGDYGWVSILQRGADSTGNLTIYVSRDEQALTSNGTAGGVFTVADATKYPLGSVVYLNDTDTVEAAYYVIANDGVNTVTVSATSRYSAASSITAYTTAQAAYAYTKVAEATVATGGTLYTTTASAKILNYFSKAGDKIRAYKSVANGSQVTAIAVGQSPDSKLSLNLKAGDVITTSASKDVFASLIKYTEYNK